MGGLLRLRLKEISVSYELIEKKQKKPYCLSLGYDINKQAQTTKWFLIEY